MKINQRGLDLIKHFESLHDGDLSRVGAQPKMDPIGIWTVGYGHAVWNPARQDWYKGEKDRAAVYGLYPSLTETQAETLLEVDLQTYGATVLKMITRRDLNEDQYAALVSFCYNAGTHYKSGGEKIPYAIWRNVNAGMPAEQLRTYWETSVIKAGGSVLPGLVRRRKSEAHLFITGQLKLNW